jgi:uncharacterized protein (TIRG00374 family)
VPKNADSGWALSKAWHYLRVSNQKERVRRPLDVARLMVVIAFGSIIFASGWLAASTTSALDTDILQATSLLPSFLVITISAISGFLTLLLPIGLVFVGLVERKIRLVLDALLGALLTILLIIASNSYIYGSSSNQLILTLAGTNTLENSNPLSALLAATVALSVVLRFSERKPWSYLTVTVIVILSWSSVVAGASTLVAQILSISIGWAAGLLVRVILGTPSTRPSSGLVLRELNEANFEVSQLQPITNTQYLATSDSGVMLHVNILDRDSDRAGFLGTLWRTLRLRGIDSGSGLSMRARAERLMLSNLSAQKAAVKTADVLAIREVTPDAIMVVREVDTGIHLSESGLVGPDLATALDGVWATLAALHEQNIAHRRANLSSFLWTDGQVSVTNLDTAVVAASDLLMALDVAELLLATTHVVGAAQAVALAKKYNTPTKVDYASRVLQPIAMSSESRTNLRTHKSSLPSLRSELTKFGIGSDGETINLERLKPRSIILLIISVFAGYTVITQTVNVNINEIFADADFGWAAIAVGLSALTYLGATITLHSLVTSPVSWLRTYLAQLAAAFLTLVTPPAVGTVAMNVRYLQRSGINPAAAAATVAMSQVAMFGSHLLMLLFVGVTAGTTSELNFEPPKWLTFFIVLLAFIVILVVSIPFGRDWLLERSAEFRKQMMPALNQLVTQPRKLISAAFGATFMNSAYILCLFACIRAFGNDTELITVAFIYLAGATLGSLAPTPGGLGAVEAVLVAALTAGGLPATIAISATLLYRVVTFWLPMLPGWISFGYLGRKGAL